jgi:hypothetical protein
MFNYYIDDDARRLIAIDSDKPKCFKFGRNNLIGCYVNWRWNAAAVPYFRRMIDIATQHIRTRKNEFYPCSQWHSTVVLNGSKLYRGLVVGGGDLEFFTML